MGKELAVFLYGVVVLFLGILRGDAVSVVQLVDRDVKAGKDFEVVVTVRKGDLESFARYEVELPRGLTAVRGQSANSAYSFDDQRVRFVWLRLPMEEKVEIRYSVRVDERMMGQFKLGGNFDYIASNARQRVAVNEETIKVQPSATVPPAQRLDIGEYQRTMPAQRPLDMGKLAVRCIRETPSILAPGPDRVVRLLVNRGEVESFAKIEERIPEGYAVESMEKQGAQFAFERGVVSFMWSQLPPEKSFVVSYRLVPNNGKEGSTPKIDGRFSFILDGMTRVISIPERDMQLENLSTGEVEQLVRATPVRVPARGALTPGGGQKGGGVLVAQGPSEGGIDFPVRYGPIEARRKGRSVRAISMDEYLLEPEQGVYYRVQVAAGHRPIDIDRYFRRRSLHADVRTERHEGWYKYSVGSFREYKEARDYRTQIWSTTPIRDAFVSAYNNGQRITVQEALMITSQKWYK